MLEHAKTLDVNAVAPEMVNTVFAMLSQSRQVTSAQFKSSFLSIAALGIGLAVVGVIGYKIMHK